MAVAFQDAHSFPGAQGDAASRTRVPDALFSAQLPKPHGMRRRLCIMKSRLVRGAGVRRSGSLRMLASSTGSKFDQKEDDVVPDAIQFLLDRSPALFSSLITLKHG